MATVNGSPQFLKLVDMMHNFNIINKYKSDLYRVSPVSRFCNKYSRTYVVIVGSNPSNKSPDDSAFHPSTKSRQTVDKWFEGIDEYDISYINLVDKKTDSNKPLKVTDINENEVKKKLVNITAYKSHKIIACGNMASAGLKKAGIQHFKMPHPSGLNHFWNDKEKAKEKIEEMLSWLREI